MEAKKVACLVEMKVARWDGLLVVLKDTVLI